MAVRNEQTMALLTTRSLKKHYQTGSEILEVLRNVNLSVDAGSTVVITGESGCGKTSLLSLIGGLDTPTSGQIYVGDEEITTLREEALSDYRRDMVGFIFQFHFLLRDFTALENIMMPAYIAGEKPKAAVRKARELIESVGLSARAHHYPVELSGGERQRVAVARALVNEPSIILADEPTGNLDERNSKVVEDLLFDLVRKYKKTLVLVTHDRGLARLSDRHFELVHGVLQAE
jgi:lipoprotein-releasing system ATP-binding protein